MRRTRRNVERKQTNIIIDNIDISIKISCSSSMQGMNDSEKLVSLLQSTLDPQVRKQAEDELGNVRTFS